MLKEEVEQYTNLTGEDGWHVPIMKVGAYLDGYDKGLEVLDKIRAEIAEYKDDKIIHTERNEMIDIVLEIIDKYRESEE